MSEQPARQKEFRVTATTVVAAVVSLAYLALCAYGIQRTGSTAGLDTIGHALAAVLAAIVIWRSAR